MYLARARLFGVAPFGDQDFPFRTAEGQPRMLTVVHGGGGVGKTALLRVLAATRPGHATVLSTVGATERGRPAAAICDWMLGDDDPQRPHPLCVSSSNLQFGADDADAAMRRREQNLFDKRAKEGGFVFLALSGARWFSAQPVALHAPLRTVANYDVRATAGLDDASRSDLTRETKQALAYAGIASALMPDPAPDRGPPSVDTRRLGTAMRQIVHRLVGLAGYGYHGIHPASLEPTFATRGGRQITFERLPNRARHLVAFAALTIRTLWAAYPGRDPRKVEGVVAIDEVDLHQDPAVQEALPNALRDSLPRVQWILTTSSPVIAAACDARDVLALRRIPEREHIELFVGQQARTH